VHGVRAVAYGARRTGRGLSGLLRGESARLDEAIEIAAIEKQSSHPGKCNPRERAALD
jgi:hypothetical protein